MSMCAAWKRRERLRRCSWGDTRGQGGRWSPRGRAGCLPEAPHHTWAAQPRASCPAALHSTGTRSHKAAAARGRGGEGWISSWRAASRGLPTRMAPSVWMAVNSLFAATFALLQITARRRPPQAHSRHVLRDQSMVLQGLCQAGHGRHRGDRGADQGRGNSSEGGVPTTRWQHRTPHTPHPHQTPGCAACRADSCPGRAVSPGAGRRSSGCAGLGCAWRRCSRLLQRAAHACPREAGNPPAPRGCSWWTTARSSSTSAKKKQEAAQSAWCPARTASRRTASAWEGASCSQAARRAACQWQPTQLRSCPASTHPECALVLWMPLQPSQC